MILLIEHLINALCLKLSPEVVERVQGALPSVLRGLETLSASQLANLVLILEAAAGALAPLPKVEPAPEQPVVAAEPEVVDNVG